MTATKNVYELYDALHAIPEVGFEEVKTAAFLAEKLKKAGFAVQTGVGRTGVVGTLRAQSPGPVLGLRADMDALPYVVDGKPCAKHTCGHDAHCAMVLTAALMAAGQGIRKGTLKILFQPSEEPDNGALEVIKDKAIDDMDYLFAMHIRPKQEIRCGQATPAMLHGSCYMLTAAIEGVSAHAGRPHLAVSAVDAAVLATNAINAIHADPNIQNSAKVTMIQSGGNGEALNTIPDRAKMAIDLRAQTNPIMRELIDKVTFAVEQSAAVIGARATVTNLGGVPAAENNEEAVKLAAEAIAEVLGPGNVVPQVVSPGGDDFNYYLQHKPTLKSTYIGLGTDASPGLHHPEMRFTKEAMENGVRIFEYLIRKILG